MESLKQYPISLHEVLKAKSTIAPYLSPTPLHRYENLSRHLNCNVYIKHENYNPTGSFKIRGGINMMSQVQRQKLNGVVTFSTGSHGLSVGTAAKLFNLPAIVVVPNQTNPAKIQLIKDTGADVLEAGDSFDESAQVVARLNEEQGYYYVHPANEPCLINGVGTEFIEIIEKLPDIDSIILPLGGGSEVAAAVTTLKALKPDIEIYAVQAKASCAAYCSWKKKEICVRHNRTFAGGFATGSAYQTTFDIYKDALTDFILLEEEEILRGISLAAHFTHNMLEGAGSSTLMAAWKLKDRLQGKNVVLQFSGANAAYTEIKEAYGLSALETGEFSASA